jgi:hypothetical protein
MKVIHGKPDPAFRIAGKRNSSLDAAPPHYSAAPQAWRRIFA